MAPLGRYVLVFGGFAAAVGLTLYPIFFYPMTHLGEYSKGGPAAFFAGSGLSLGGGRGGEGETEGRLRP